MTNALLVLTYPEAIRNVYADAVRTKFPQIKLSIADHHSKVGPYIAETEILLTFATMMADPVLRDAPKLKWVQALGTGTDGILDAPSLRSEVIVTNIRDIQKAPMSEAALVAMLALSRDLPRSLRNQERHRWERWPTQLLTSKTAGILGVGAVAEALAPRLKVMGMTVVGFTATKRQVAGFDRIYPRSELKSVAGELDFLVVLIPYTPESRKIVSGEILAAMKPTSYVINLARGGVLDEQALAEALNRGQIAGAALDVFEREPLPEDDPLWTAKNIIITGHLGGFYDRYAHDALPTVEENLRRYLVGDTGRMVNRIEH